MNASNSNRGFKSKNQKRIRETNITKMFRHAIALGMFSMSSAYAADESSLLNKEVLIRSFSGSKSIYDLAWSPDQSKIAVRGRNIYLWDLLADREIWDVKGVVDTQNGLAVSTDGQYVILPASGEAPHDYPDTAASSAALTLLSTADVSPPKYVEDPEYNNGVNRTTALATSSDGSLLAASVGIASGQIALYDPTTWKLIKHVGPFKNSRGIAVTPNMVAIDAKNKLIVGAYVSGEVQVWNYETNSEVSRFQSSLVALRAIDINSQTGEIITGKQEVAAVRFPDGHTAGSTDESPIELDAWNSRTGKLVRTYSGAKLGIRSISVSPNGLYVAATEGGSSVGMRLNIWNASTGALIKSIEYNTHNGLSPLKFSPDGTKLAVGNDDEVHIYNLN